MEQKNILVDIKALAQIEVARLKELKDEERSAAATTAVSGEARIAQGASGIEPSGLASPSASSPLASDGPKQPTATAAGLVRVSLAGNRLFSAEAALDMRPATSAAIHCLLNLLLRSGNYQPPGAS